MLPIGRCQFRIYRPRLPRALHQQRARHLVIRICGIQIFSVDRLRHRLHLPRRRPAGSETDAPADRPAAEAARPIGYLTVLKDGRYRAYLFMIFANAVICIQMMTVLPLAIKRA